MFDDNRLPVPDTVLLGKKKKTYSSFEKGSLCNACLAKVEPFLEKMLRKSNFAFNESGYISRSRYNKAGNLKQAEEKNCEVAF